MNKREKILSAVFVCVAILICIIGFYRHRAFYQDDAFITLRYCQNFLDGNGIVWNPGERVEGYSNFLHLIFVSLLGKAGIDLVVASKIVGVTSFVGLIVFAGLYLRSLPAAKLFRQNSLLRYTPMLLILTSFPLIIWSLSGMESLLFTFLCTIGIWLMVKAIDCPQKGRLIAVSGLAFSLAATTRPDGIIFAVIAFMFLLYLFVKKKDVKIKQVLLFILCFFLIFGPYFVWRSKYYGNILPNTFYVKADGFDGYKLISGIKYLIFYFASPPYFFLGLTLLIPYSLFKKTWDDKKTYLLLNIVLFTAYILYLGGDHMLVYRFFLPLVPVTVLLVYFLAIPLIDHLKGTKIFVISYLVLFCVGLQIFHIDEDSRKMDPAAFIGTIVGKYINEAWPKGSLVALNTAGSTPYYAPDNAYIDMLGLNDAHIAKRVMKEKKLYWQSVPGHAKGDGAYVLSRRPDYIIMGSSNGSSADDPWFLSDLELSRDPKFNDNYQKKYIEISTEDIPGYEKYRKTSSGTLKFTYYEHVPNTKN